jgi:hypothetical protein
MRASAYRQLFSGGKTYAYGMPNTACGPRLDAAEVEKVPEPILKGIRLGVTINVFEACRMKANVVKSNHNRRFECETSGPYMIGLAAN